MRRILIVDDDLELASVIQEKTRACGESDVCTSGYQAMTQLRSGHYDMVVTDYSMQDGDGASLAHFCHANGIGVIVISSFPEAHIQPYLPHSVTFLNKFHAVRGKTLEDLIKERRILRMTKTS
jgi:CheY-like chemotaxis protein